MMRLVIILIVLLLITAFHAAEALVETFIAQLF
ncbi:type I toxin-antitoxin system Ibs family toxin, partial [Escherichia coli]|nr:type I toxin-antitoxin system Ibs family toxin [Escherichia coli]